MVPTLLIMLHNGDTDAVPHLTALVGQLRQHLRRWLPDLVHLIHQLWPRPVTPGQQPSKLLLNLLDLLACLAGVRPYMFVLIWLWLCNERSAESELRDA